MLQGYYNTGEVLEQMGSATLGMPSTSKRVHRPVHDVVREEVSEADLDVVEVKVDLYSSNSSSESPGTSGRHASEGN